MGAQGEGSKGEENSSTLFFVAALVVAADEAGAGLLGVFFHQERRAALRAGLRHRPVPEGEVALGVVRAGVERAAFLAPLLREVAAVLGALDAEREGLRVLAGRVRRAREELAEPAALDHHWGAALLTLLVGRDLLLGDDLDGAVGQPLKVLGVLAGRVLLVARAGQELPVPAPLDLHHPAALLARDVGRRLDRVFGAGEVLGFFDVLAERQVEIAHRGDPLFLTFLDLVQFLLHQRREVHVEDVWKPLDEEVIHSDAGLRGREAAVHFLDVPALLDRGGDARVGRGPADPFLFQFLDEQRLAVPGRRLGEVLLRREARLGLTFLRDEGQALPFGEDRQLPLGLVLLFGRPLRFAALRGELRVLAFLVHRQMAGELHDGPRGPEHVGIRRALGHAVHAGDFQEGRGHLGGDEAGPDQLVKLVVVAIQERPDGLGIAVDRCRSDRLVGILGGLLGLEDVQGGGQVLAPEPLADELPGFFGRLTGDSGGVGAHVGDQPGRPLLADVHALVKLLGQVHGLLGAEAQLARRLLLEPAGDEGRHRIALLLLALDGLHDEGLAPDRRHDALGLRGRADVRLPAVDAVELGLEGRRVLPGQRRRYGPVLLRAEGFALALALADQLDGHRLYPPHAEATADLLPQQLAALVADDAIEHAPGLLRVDQVHVDLAGGLKGALDGRLRDLVEEDPEDLAGWSFRLPVN